jgi:hypothetical protein
MSLVKKSTQILFKALPLVAVVAVVKVAVHYGNLEVLTVNALFSGIIGATVFLMGFLLTGVLTDFKESEKLPGEIASIIATLADEMEILIKSKPDRSVRSSLVYLYELAQCIRDWIYKKEKTRTVMERIRGLNEHFILFETLTQVNYVTRLKSEQNNLRKLIIRIHTIRETNFISSGYFIAISTVILLIGGLVFSKIEPFYESLFTIGIVSYLLTFLLLLIRDLDNPFGYYDGGSSEDVSLKPIEDIISELDGRLEQTAPEAKQ